MEREKAVYRPPVKIAAFVEQDVLGKRWVTKVGSVAKRGREKEELKW
jgi:hypothetical protein